MTLKLQKPTMVFTIAFFSTKSKFSKKGIVQGRLTKISEIHIFVPGRHVRRKNFPLKMSANSTRRCYKAWIHYFHRFNHTVVTFIDVGHIDPPPSPSQGCKIYFASRTTARINRKRLLRMRHTDNSTIKEF